MYNEIIREWIQASSSHGLPNIFRTKNRFIKFLWVLMFILSFGYCLLTIINSFSQYVKYETSVQTDLLRDIPSTFPAVTICNVNPFDYRENQEYFDKMFDENGLHHAMQINQPFSEFVYLNNSYELEKYFDIFNKMKRIISTDPSLNETSKQKLGFDLRTYMLVSCYYNGKQCNASDFTKAWDDNYGNCYSFNTGRDSNGNDVPFRVTSRAGTEFGLELELLIGNPDLIEQFSNRQGMHVFIHNNSEPYFLSTNVVTVPTGYESFIQVSRTYNQKLGKPYSDCLDSLTPFSEYSQKLFGYMVDVGVYKYNSDFCQKMCYQDKLIDECSCCDITVPKIRNSSACMSDEEIECLKVVNDLFSVSDIQKICNYSCPVECTSMDYSLKDHKSRFPTNFYYSQLMTRALISDQQWDGTFANSPFDIIIRASLKFVNEKPLGLRLMRENLLRLSINYEDLRIVCTQEVPVLTFDTLLGVLGGQLGLFIGISVLSFVEILELFLDIIWYSFKDRKKE